MTADFKLIEWVQTAEAHRLALMALLVFFAGRWSKNA